MTRVLHLGESHCMSHILQLQVVLAMSHCLLKTLQLLQCFQQPKWDMQYAWMPPCCNNLILRLRLQLRPHQLLW